MSRNRWQIWTASQRRGLALLLGIVVAILLLRLVLNPASVTDPQPPAGQRADQLADRLDPNAASAAELAAIPGLGQKRAAAIVEFRDRFRASHPGQTPFRRPLDLEQVRGIGSAMAENIEPYLVFQSAQDATSRPSL